MSKQFLVVLSGPPAVGKNTVARKLSRHFPATVATVCLDDLKRFVESDPRTDRFLDLAAKVALSMTRLYLADGLSVIVHNAFCKYAFVRPFLAIADEMHIQSWYFKLTAPLKELVRRNQARTRPCAEADLRRIHALDQQHAHPAGIVIDTLTRDADGSARLILERVSSAATTDGD